MIGMYVTGLNEMISMLRNAEKEFPGMVKSTMAHACVKAKSEAERLCPVATGELLDSIYCEHDENGFELGATAKHAVFNEYGCYNIKVPGKAKFQGSRPFLRPSLYKIMNEIPNIFSKNWKRTLHG